MNFKEWCDAEFSRMAAEYRSELAYRVRTMNFLIGFQLTDEEFSLCLDTLREVPIPTIGKYPGEVSSEERSWYAVAPRPQWAEIRREYEEQIKQLLNVAGSDAGK